MRWAIKQRLCTRECVAPSERSRELAAAALHEPPEDAAAAVVVGEMRHHVVADKFHGFHDISLARAGWQAFAAPQLEVSGEVQRVDQRIAVVAMPSHHEVGATV